MRLTRLLRLGSIAVALWVALLCPVPVEAQNASCGREIWVFLDCSGSMYLEAPQYLNKVVVNHQTMNLLEASARSIDAIRAADPDVHYRLFAFHETVRELPLSKSVSVFQQLDNNSDGRINERDSPGAFPKSETRTNLVSPLAAIRSELGLESGSQRAVGIVWFTDGNSNYTPPAFSGRGRDYLMRECSGMKADLAARLGAQRAFIRVVGLTPSLVDARALAEQCLALGDQSLFIDAAHDVGGVLQSELKDVLASLEQLKIDVERPTVAWPAINVRASVAAWSCSGVTLAGFRVRLRGPGGQIWHRDAAQAGDTIPSGSSTKMFDLSFPAGGVPEGDYDAAVQVVGSGGRVLGESTPVAVRYVQDRLEWEIVARQTGLNVTGIVRVGTTLTGKVVAKLSGFRLKSGEAVHTVSLDAIVWDQVPVGGETLTQVSEREFRFVLPRSVRAAGARQYAIEPVFETSRAVPVQQRRVSISHDGELGASIENSSISYAPPSVEQGPPIEQPAERGSDYLIPLRATGNVDFADPEGTPLDLSVARVGNQKLALPPAQVIFTMGNRVHQYLLSRDTVSSIVEKLGLRGGRHALEVDLRSSQLAIVGTARMQIDVTTPVLMQLQNEKAAPYSFEVVRETGGRLSIEVPVEPPVRVRFATKRARAKPTALRGGVAVGTVGGVWLKSSTYLLPRNANKSATITLALASTNVSPVKVRVQLEPLRPESEPQLRDIVLEKSATVTFEVPASAGRNVYLLRILGSAMGNRETGAALRTLRGSAEVSSVLVIFERKLNVPVIAFGTIILVALALGVWMVIQWVRRKRWV